MISTLILAAALSGCPGGVCAAPVAKIIHRERTVVVNREVQPVRKVAAKVRHRDRFILRRR